MKEELKNFLTNLSIALAVLICLALIMALLLYLYDVNANNNICVKNGYYEQEYGTYNLDPVRRGYARCCGVLTEDNVYNMSDCRIIKEK